MIYIAIQNRKTQPGLASIGVWHGGTRHILRLHLILFGSSDTRHTQHNWSRLSNCEVIRDHLGCKTEILQCIEFDKAIRLP